MNTLVINKSENDLQIFETVQGEGVFLGVPSFFIRLQGCSVNCFFCDEKKTWAKGDAFGAELSYEAILNRLREMNPILKRVVITGGEPTEQNIVKFIKFLNQEGYQVAVESAMTGPFTKELLDYSLGLGSIDPLGQDFLNSENCNTVVRSLWLTFSPKAIYSKNGEPADERVYSLVDEIKFVIANEKAVLFLENVLLKKILHEEGCAKGVQKPVFLAPDWNNLEENIERIKALLKEYPDVLRLGIQAHKYWGIA